MLYPKSCMQRLRSWYVCFSKILHIARFHRTDTFLLQAREKDITRRRETELEQQLINERNAHSARESALLEANGKLLLRVEELSDSIARLQAQVCRFSHD